MKRIAILLLALLLLGCGSQSIGASAVPTETPTEAPTEASAETPTEEPSCAAALIGDWELSTVEIAGETYDPAAAGLNSVFTFAEDGTGVLRMWTGDNVQEQVITYTVSGNAVTMFDENNDPQDAVYDPETDTVRMEEESLGMLLVLVRKTETAPAEAPTEDDWTKAELEMREMDGAEMVSITALIPAGATLLIDFPHQDDYTFTNTEAEARYRRVNIPVEVFFPNEPLSEQMLTLAPKVTISTADGAVQEIDCPTFDHTFPMLLLAIDTAGETREDGFYAVADADGVYRLLGMMLSSEEGMPPVAAGVTLTVNGTETVVYEGGIFFADLPCVDGVPTTYTLTAQKDNYMTVVATVVVQPFVQGNSADL